LLAGIFVALIVLVFVVLNSGKNQVPKSKTHDSEKTATTDRDPSPGKDEPRKDTHAEERPPLKAGESTTRERAEEKGLKVNKPSAPVSPARVESTYEVGKKYRSIIRFEMNGRGKAKDYAIETTSNFVYIGEMQFTRAIESNDGKKIVLTQTFDRAQNLRIATDIENIEVFKMGLGGESALLLIDWLGSATLKLKPGWSEDIRGTAQFLADTQVIKDLLSRVAERQTGQVLAYIDQIQGKSIRITYVNGEGVQKIEPLGCELSSNEQDLIFASAILSDTYVLPDTNAKVGDEWTLNASDVLPLIDPSIHAQLEGAISARRGEDQGTDPNRKAVVNLVEGGYYELRGFDKSNAYFGRWNPTGQLIFSFNDKIVTSGLLGGTFEVNSHSTDHWIFEASFSTKPRYKVIYTGLVL